MSNKAILRSFTASLALLCSGSVFSAPLNRAGAVQKFEKLPLYFEPNRGQAQKPAEFIAKGKDHLLAIDGSGATLVAGAARVRLSLLGGKRQPASEGLNPLPGHTNYLLGNDPGRHMVDVPQYARVRYSNVYPDIDLVYNGRGGKLEFDFELGPGADPSRIRLHFEGTRPIDIDHGDLRVVLAGGELRLPRPVAWQTAESGRTEITTAYVLHGNDVSLRVGAFDPHKPLTIDPQLSYLSYLGGSGLDYVNSIALDSNSNIWVAGYTTTTNLAVAGGPGGQPAPTNAFVAKLDPTGASLLLLTYIGGNTGSMGDKANSIAVDNEGNAYVTGAVNSSNFPLLHALQSTGGIFILELNSSGNALVYSTRWGSLTSSGNAIAVDQAGDAYVAATSMSSSSVLLGSTYGGGHAAYQTACYNSCALVVEIVAGGSDWAFSTFLGGSGMSYANGIAVDASGVYVTGQIWSGDFPVRNALQTSRAGNSDAFVAKLIQGGTAVAFATYLGGADGDNIGNAIGVDGAENVYVAGQTSSTHFPTANAAQSASGGAFDAFVSAIKADGSAFLYSTYLGGNSDDIAHAITVGSDGTATVAGSTLSPGFPMASAIQSAQASPGGALHSSNGGTNWSGPGGSGGLVVNSLSTDPNNAQNAWVATPNGIYRTTDGGSTWSQSNSGLGFITATSVAANPGANCALYAGLDSGHYQGTYGTTNYNYLLATSTNCGASWSFANDAVYLARVNKMAVTGDGHVWYTANANGTATQRICVHPALGNGFLCEADPSYYGTNALAARNCFLAMGDWQGKVTLATTCDNPVFSDTGAAFSKGVTALAIQSDQPTLVAGTSSGDIWRKADSTSAWTKAGTLDGTVNALAADPSNNSTIVYAGTSGGSVFKSTDGGQTWSPTSYANGTVAALATTPGVVWAGSSAISDAFITQLTPAGAIAFSTFLGGNGIDSANSVVAGGSTIYVAGETSSSNLLASSNAVQMTSGGGHDGFIAEITGLNMVNIAVTSNPSGLTAVVDNTNCTTPCTAQWQIGTTHTIDVPTPASSSDTEYSFASWSNSGTQSQTVTASAAVRTYTATFALQYLVSLQAGAGGTITTASQFYTAGQQVTLTAKPSTGYAFSSWSGTGLGSYTGTTNPAPITVNGPIGETASFQSVQSSAALAFIPIAPCRAVDTRNAAGALGGPSLARNASRDFAIAGNVCAIPSSASAYSLNITVVPHGFLGYVTVWPSGGAHPVVSTLNSLDGRIKANADIVPAGTNGAVSVYATDNTDLVLDIDGYFVPAGSASSLAFYPLTPCRVVDTRGGAGPTLSAGQSRTFAIAGNCSVPSAAQAYSLNFTVVPKTSLGYLTVWPTGQQKPVVSTLNALTGAITANAAIVPAGTSGDLSAYVTDATDLIIDVNGYFAPPGTGGLSFYNLAPCRVLDTRNPSGSPPITTKLDVNVTGACSAPSTAQAYAFNATVVPPALLGYITLWPQGQSQPVVSTLNAFDGAITSNMAIVPTNNGSISTFPSSATHLILDIGGYFAP